MVKTVVILGAGWAGLPFTHKLLESTLPKAKEGLKVILVSPNSHFYWNVAATRAVIPGSFSDNELFLPIEPGFARYTASDFEFVLGKAERLDPEQSIVEIHKNDGTRRNLTYDHIVIASGSQILSNLPFKGVGTHEETIAALHTLQKQIEVAKFIVVAGAGPTGVETVGELAAAYGREKNITLVIGGERVLQASPVLPSVSQRVERDLQKLGVKLVRNVRVKHMQISAKGEDDGAAKITTLMLSSGETLVTDLYLPLFGIQVHTKFVPASLLDDSGNLALEKTMRVAGTENVWGIGDVGNIEVKQLTVTDAQIIHLAGALDSVLTAEGQQVQDYRPSAKTMVFITMGKKYATGQIGGWKLWSWLTAYVKGRMLFVDTAPDYVGGKRLRHASM